MRKQRSGSTRRTKVRAETRGFLRRNLDAFGRIRWSLPAPASLGVILTVLVVAPYFRGLYFTGEQLVASLVVLGAFAYRCREVMARRDESLVWTRLDYLALGLWGVYIVALGVAVDVRASVQEAIKIGVLSLLYWLVRDTVRERAAVRMVLWALLGAGTWMAVFGVAAAAGNVQFLDSVQGFRIASTLQYPNTLGAYLSVSVLCGLTLFGMPQGPASRALTAACTYLSFFVFVFTYSRGAWLVSVPALAALVLLQPAGRRLALFLTVLALGVVFVPFGFLFARAFEAGQPWGLWGSFVGGLPLILLLLAAIDHFERAPQRVRAFILSAMAGAAVVVVLVTLAAPQVVPAALVERVRSISLDDYSAWSRIQWSGDALRMIADRPVLGGGGGAWAALYRIYQSFDYTSTQAHNHFLQLWLEVGTVGFLIWLVLWAMLLLALFRACRAAPQPEDRATVVGVGVAAVTLGAHSLIDFNLSLMAVSMALWALFGLAQALELMHLGVYDRQRRVRQPDRLWRRLALYGATLAFGLVVASLTIGYYQGQKAALAAQAGDLEAAARYFDRAMRFDPFTATFYFDRARIYQAMDGSPAATAKAIRLMERALRLDPYDPDLHSLFGGFLFNQGEFGRGLQELHRATELHPFSIRRREQLARGYVLAAVAMMDQGDTAKAREYLGSALAIPGDVARLAASVPPQVPDYMRTPTMTPGLALSVGQANAILRNWPEAERHLRLASEAQDAEIKAEALVWLAAVLQETNRPDDARSVLEEARKIKADADALAEAVRQRLKGL